MLRIVPRRAWLSALGPLLAGGVALAAAVAKPVHAHADGEAEAAASHERCATRLSIAFLGKSASPDLMAAPDPQAAVDTLLKDPAFIERFARFVNAEMNPEPGMLPGEDAAYTLSKFILTDGSVPWKDMFVGPYDVTDTVTPDPNGLGYFRSDAWMKRYAGNELAGYRLSSAYRILQNTTGLQLTATTNVEGVDLSADGRKSPACAGCHYNGWFALDLVARTLSKRKGTGDKITFTPPTEGPQTILGGQQIADDKSLVEALVASDDFKFHTCRLAFQFLYGRAETTCEGQVFDKCIDAFGASGTMQSALGAIAKDPGFCQ
jgi:hypothetical protein